MNWDVVKVFTRCSLFPLKSRKASNWACLGLTTAFIASLSGQKVCAEERSPAASQIAVSGFTRQGRFVRGSVEAKSSPADLAIVSQGERFPFLNFSRIDLPQKCQKIPLPGTRRIRFTNGDVVHGQLMNERDQISLQWSSAGSKNLPLALSSLDAIFQPLGQRLVQTSHFEIDSGGWTHLDGTEALRTTMASVSGSYALDCQPGRPSLQYLCHIPERGLLVFFFRVQKSPSGVDPTATETPTGLTFRFSTNSGQNPPDDIRLQLFDETYETEAMNANWRWQQQVLSSSPGWHRFELCWDSSQIEATIDGFLSGTGAWSTPHRFQELKIESYRGNGLHDLLIDDVTILKLQEEPPPSLQTRKQDEVQTLAGDVFGGRVEELTADRLKLATDSNAGEFPLTEIDEIQFASRSFEYRPVSGLISTFLMQPFRKAEQLQQCDRFRGALVGVHSQFLLIDHCVLGQIQIPISQTRQIRPDFQGTELCLLGQVVHLGDEHKQNFQQQVPCGRTYSQTFHWNSTVTGTIHLEMIESELEPSGPGTKPYPLLRELQSGGLISEIWINSRRLEELNRMVTRRGTRAYPERLLILLPPKLLKSGDNLIEIRTRPSHAETSEYDDWEIHSLNLRVSD